jgi:adenylylsulfate kinase
MNKFLTKTRGKVSRSDRERLNCHRSAVFWLTGLSGSGKSTIAHEVEKRLHDQGMQVYVFDGDNVRHGLCGDLSFSLEARAENIRRIAEACKLFLENGTICLCAFISPMEKDREKVKEIVGEDFREVYIKCPLETCESRDVKGYYKLAREGKIKNYTGISSPYEAPSQPDLVLETEIKTIEESTEEFERFILSSIVHEE